MKTLLIAFSMVVTTCQGGGPVKVDPPQRLDVVMTQAHPQQECDRMGGTLIRTAPLPICRDVDY